VFDDKLVEILRKYGFLGPLIAGAATASMPDEARKLAEPPLVYPSQGAFGTSFGGRMVT
jgi:hypothetical protein